MMWANWGLPKRRIVEGPYRLQTFLPLWIEISCNTEPCVIMRVLQRSPVREIRTPGSARGVSVLSSVVLPQMQLLFIKTSGLLLRRS